MYALSNIDLYPVLPRQSKRRLRHHRAPDSGAARDADQRWTRTTRRIKVTLIPKNDGYSGD